ncbi:hypothetical protein ACMBCN_03215, partial [Candidatus Liberibacter asiaticus]|nr:hypothetical protein [Candidatus Liberibacter asiaticus]
SIKLKKDLKDRKNQLKSQTNKDLKDLKIRVQILKLKGKQSKASSNKEEEFTTKEKDVQKEIELNEIQFINSMDKVINHKWYSKVTIIINKEYQFIVEP